MKKFLKYICFFTVLFSLCFIDTVKADDDYLFYCDYDISANYKIEYKQYSRRLKLRAMVYSNNSKFFILGDNDNLEEITFKDGNSGNTHSSNLFLIGSSTTGYRVNPNISEYYNNTTKNGKYICPTIRASISYYKVRGVDYPILNLNSGKSSSVGTGYKSYDSTSGLVKNPNLVGTPEGDDIDNNVLLETQVCPGKTIEAGTKKELLYDIEIKPYMNSLGEKRIKITLQSGQSEEAVFSPVSGAEITIERGTDNQGNKIKDKFIFYPEDDKNIFNQNEMQKENNTFTCPNRIPTIGLVDNVNNNSTASHFGTHFVIAYSDEVESEYGIDGTFDEALDVDLEGLDKYLDQIVSGSRGTCTKYLGSASEEGTIAEFLDKIYTLIKIGSIILVIVLSMLDFANSITKTKDDLMEIVIKTGKRLILLVLVLLLPTFIDIIGNMFNIEDILCGIK